MKWSILPLDEIADVDWGNTSITKASYVQEGFKAFSASGDDGFLSNYEHDGAGIILSAIGAKCGKCFFYDGKWTAIKNTITIKNFRKESIDPKFVFYFLDKNATWPKRGGGQPFIALSDARKLKIPIPPLSEQRRIVEILDQTNIIRHKRTEADDKTNRVLQSIFLKIFGDPATNPKKWPIVTGKELFSKVRYGVGSPPPFSASGIPFLRAGNIKPDGIKTDGLTYFDPIHAKSIKRSQVYSEDIVIVRRGVNTGDCTMITDEFDGAFVGYDLICTPNEGTNSHWFITAWNFPTVWQKIDKLRSRAAQQGLNKEQIESFVLPRPPQDLQEKFSAFFVQLKQLIDDATKARTKLDILFATLLQHAFSGELTAKWRETHMKELAADMEQHSSSKVPA